MSGDEVRTVVVDTSVMINLAILDRIGLLGILERFRFVVPGEVVAEVRRAEQRKRVRTALETGLLTLAC